MSEPVYNVQFTDQQAAAAPKAKRTNPREVIAVVLLLLGVVCMTVGVGGYLDSLWAGVATAGLVLTVLGVLLGNN